MPESEPRNIIERFIKTVNSMVEGPVVFVRENIVKPNQQSYPWYHRKYKRVPTIDECYTDDPVCIFEANQQYKRDRMVDNEVLSILKQRFEDCVAYEAPDHMQKCKPLFEQLKEAETNWFIKYGDLGGDHDVRQAYMKQKHRMVWERRHGPVGSGMKVDDNASMDNEDE